MAITITQLLREFTYNGMTLLDPGPAFAPDQVRDMYTAQYPELTTAAVEGPEHTGDKARYKFVRAAGAKG
ncbi:carbamoylphosphate synthase large subunit (plasmid) [Cupriavidus sp. USMAA2-4]|jgi:PRTRC genetic system protein C|uniref:PRTRC system protein C n=1 Tax=unclassified Cupriavidus TaxID=2640874 RepID=UPI0008A6E0C6|nr:MULTISPECIES: PRTRC system protein C [unclassified Cupriavidus]AOY97743.1 carbamoylphosphate synthase large subunit [Cupriavidus sp. USMAA2-4]AOZ04221.1 carbamoylphosphate synthase large subunit [Cupriavidus sp. USMAHM13]